MLNRNFWGALTLTFAALPGAHSVWASSPAEVEALANVETAQSGGIVSVESDEQSAKAVETTETDGAVAEEALELSLSCHSSNPELPEYREALNRFEAAFAAGDRAAEIALRVHQGAEPTAQDSGALAELASGFAAQAIDGIESLDFLSQSLEALKGEDASEESIKAEAGVMVIGDLIRKLKRPALRFGYAGMATIDCKMSWEEGYEPGCEARKVTPFFVREVEIVEQLPVEPDADVETLRRALRGEHVRVVGTRTVDLYASFKKEVLEGMRAVCRLIRI